MHEQSKHFVAVSALVKNEDGHVLMVRTRLRSDTWELPGGFVDAGEPLDQAVCREFLEETGMVIRPVSISGVYYNERLHVLSVVFHAEYVSGEITIQPEEIVEAKFVDLDDTNLDKYITRPQIKSRLFDAIRAESSAPYETWDLNPPRYKLLSRLDGEPLNVKTAFLLTGEPRMGKTTMIKELVHHLGPDLCGGFYTEEITNSSDRIGFKCVSVSGESVEIAHVDSPSSTRIGRYGMDVEAFEDFAVNILEDALSSKKIIVIDEMGFMQMLSASFQKIVQEIISDHRIVLGTIPVESHPEIDKIKYQKEVSIISLNEFNRDTISKTLLKDILQALEGE
ncbi:Nucleoside-triphosphatase THEP1 [Paenibacillus sp. GM2FR]|uniref:nucleoside-triphosphatase n=1 Tax=Paenibacillus TaxID=44249 RepID=UPI000C270C74|nr:nucleoside-triphosphatase [Paenibacillus lautus]PJN56473.1 Nucleoside-triphosphatase THEP1 [Paenibacillus sp. GM2FR]